MLQAITQINYCKHESLFKNFTCIKQMLEEIKKTYLKNATVPMYNFET
jgi:transcriptional regulator NrdR family protein